MVASFKELSEILSVESECGNERAFAEMMAEKLLEFTDKENIEIDRLNNVIAYIGDRSKPTVMLSAHQDELSLIVTNIEDNGFLRVLNIGGTDRRTLLSGEGMLKVKAENEKGYELLPVIFCNTPPHLLTAGSANKIPEYKELFVDTGLPAEVVKQKVRPSDRIYIQAPITELINNRIAAKALDNKICVYAIMTALKKLKMAIKHNELDVCIAILFASQEEVGSRGACVGTYNINPDEAIILDVTFAKQPGVSDSAEMGKGAVIEYSTIFDKQLTNKIKKAADSKKLQYQLWAEGVNLGTDADMVQTMRCGVKTTLVSVPIRNMHTPVEVADLSDVESAADIVAAYIETYLKEDVK